MIFSDFFRIKMVLSIQASMPQMAQAYQQQQLTPQQQQLYQQQLVQQYQAWQAQQAAQGLPTDSQTMFPGLGFVDPFQDGVGAGQPVQPATITKDGFKVPQVPSAKVETQVGHLA